MKGKREMSSIKDIIKNIPASAGSRSENGSDIMMDPNYLRSSSSIISEALHKGFDVLQLENGDIVTTGTKVIVTQYHWDKAKSKMVKLSESARKKLEKEFQSGKKNVAKKKKPVKKPTKSLKKKSGPSKKRKK